MKNKKKIYISMPISGRNIEEVKVDYALASKKIEELGFIPVSPLEVSPETEASYAEHIGRDITALLQCDGMVLCGDYKSSRGCSLERFAASTYGILYYEWAFFLDNYKAIAYTLDVSRKADVLESCTQGKEDPQHD